MVLIIDLKFDKWVDVLLFLNEETYSADISNKLGITWGHVNKIIKVLTDKGFINREVDENNARKKTITLTKKGQKLRDLFKEAKKILNENETTSINGNSK